MPGDDASCRPSVRPCMNDVTLSTAARLIQSETTPVPTNHAAFHPTPSPAPTILSYANESKPVTALHLFTYGLPGNRKFGQVYRHSNFYRSAVCILHNDASNNTRTIQSLPITTATKTLHKPKASTLTVILRQLYERQN